jgi:hypothetical protein
VAVVGEQQAGGPILLLVGAEHIGFGKILIRYLSPFIVLFVALINRTRNKVPEWE